MKEIGGYFELELSDSDLSMLPSGILVNSGRHALEYIIRAVGRNMKTIWLPYYTCDVVLQPIRRLGINCKFYSINNVLEIADDIILKDGDYIIANNYFGIKDNYISELTSIYKNQLIVDNAQAFYCPESLCSNYIYSPRKFFGVPDGGIVSCTSSLEEDMPEGFSYQRCSHLLKRLDKDGEYGYEDFKSNSSQLRDEPLTCMSKLTKRLLGTIDFGWIKTKRRANFDILHSALASTNKLLLPDKDSYACPMVYPYMTNDTYLRKKLIDNKIFVAQYWTNVLDWCTEDAIEYQFANNIIPLPIDQRYGEEDITKIISLINP